MYPSVGSYTKKQVAAIVCSKENTITLNMRNVQLQAGGSDCGVFAIAFATALANNINPCECCFKQDAMRDHLQCCLESGKLTMFPLVKRRMPRKVVHHVDIIEFHCSCQMPEVPPMVECSKCKEWYHIKCVSVYPKEHWRTKVLTGTVKTVKFVYYYCNHCIGLLSLIIMTIFEHPKANCGKLDGGDHLCSWGTT